MRLLPPPLAIYLRDFVGFGKVSKVLTSPPAIKTLESLTSRSMTNLARQWPRKLNCQVCTGSWWRRRWLLKAPQGKGQTGHFRRHCARQEVSRGKPGVDFTDKTPSPTAHAGDADGAAEATQLEIDGRGLSMYVYRTR